jgi:hypothetical protein
MPEEIDAGEEVCHLESQFNHYESISCYKLPRNGNPFIRAANL